MSWLRKGELSEWGTLTLTVRSIERDEAHDRLSDTTRNEFDNDRDLLGERDDESERQADKGRVRKYD